MMHFTNHFGQSYGFVGPAQQPILPGELTYGAVAYVWVETRLCSCMPGNGDVPGVNILFMKPDMNSSFFLAHVSGVPAQVGLVLSIYSSNCANFVYQSNSNQISNPSEANDCPNNSHKTPEQPSTPAPTSLVSTPPSEKRRSLSPSPPCPEHITTVNVVVNIATYRLLTSYNCFPLRQLEWLTDAEFSIALKHTPEDDFPNADRARVCIKGAQTQVRSATVVLKEIMIFIGNRFTALFKSEQSPLKEKTEIDESESMKNTSSVKSERSKQVQNVIWSQAKVNDEPDELRGYKGCKADSLNDLEEDIEQNNKDKLQEDQVPTLQIFLVAEAETGKVIGFKGDNIRKIESDTGAYVQMAKIDFKITDREVRAVFLVGTNTAVERAMNLILNSVSYSINLSLPKQDSAAR